MASINNITIKSIKHFRDHDGCSIAQGTVYYNGKKIGFWSQDSWGGPDHMDFNDDILKNAVESYAKSDYVEDKYKDIFNIDCLFGDLLTLIDKEKQYKKGVKKGYSTYVEATDGYHVVGYYTNDDPKTAKTKEYHKNFLKEIEKMFFKDSKKDVNMYTSLDDFVISV